MPKCDTGLYISPQYKGIDCYLQLLYLKKKKKTPVPKFA